MGQHTCVRRTTCSFFHFGVQTKTPKLNPKMEKKEQVYMNRIGNQGSVRKFKKNISSLFARFLKNQPQNSSYNNTKFFSGALRHTMKGLTGQRGPEGTQVYFFIIKKTKDQPTWTAVWQKHVHSPSRAVFYPARGDFTPQGIK